MSNQEDAENARTLWSLWSVVIAGEAIFVLPFVLPRLFRPTMLSVWGLTNADIGFAFSAYGIVAVFAYFLGGPIADRWNNRRLMSIALLATAAGAIGMGAVPTPNSLKLLYAYFGCTTILLFWAPMIRVTHRLATSASRGKAFGLLDAGRGLFAAVLASGLVLVFDRLSVAGDASGAAAALQTIVAISGLLVLLSTVLLHLSLPVSADGDTTSTRVKFDWARVPELLTRPILWLHSLIVLSAYCGYKSIDNIGVYVVDVVGGSESDAAWTTTLCFWVRPVSAIAAGVVADRVKRFPTMLMLFGIMMSGCLLLAWGRPPFVSMAVVSVVVATTGAAVFGLRGVYFAVFDDMQIPGCLIGTATGIVSVLGFMPDVFFGAISGQILDSYPGLMGHRIVFVAVAIISAIGAMATACSIRLISKQSRSI